MPTIGIGAGPGCDGQVLVFHDLLGLGSRPAPKFVRQYANLGEVAVAAVAAYAADVRSGRFPGDAESYHAPAELKEALGPDDPDPTSRRDAGGRGPRLTSPGRPGPRPGPPLDTLPRSTGPGRPAARSGGRCAAHAALRSHGHLRRRHRAAGHPGRRRPRARDGPHERRDPGCRGPLGPAALRLRGQAQARGLLRPGRAERHPPDRRRAGSSLGPGRRGAPSQGHPAARQGGQAGRGPGQGGRLPTMDRFAGGGGHHARQQRDAGRQHHAGPRTAVHQHRSAHGEFRPGGQPSLAEPSDPGVGGGDELLRRGVLARDGRERERDPHQGRPGCGCRPPRAAELGDARRRPAIQGRGGRRRGRAVAALGHRPGDQERAPRPGRGRRSRGGGARSQAAPPRGDGQPAGYGFDEEPF